MPVETWSEEDGKVALRLGERPLIPEEVRTATRRSAWPSAANAQCGRA